MEFACCELPEPSLREQALRLIYPARCVLCDVLLSPTSDLLLCENCGEPLEEETIGWQLCPEWPELTAWYSPFPYAGGVEHAIRQMKYNGLPKHAETLGFLMAECLLQHCELQTVPFTGIVPVPMHPRKIRARGYNQAVILAQTLGKYLNIPVYEHAIKKTVHRRAQNGLSRQERFSVLKDSFSPVSGGEVPRTPQLLLVDDVVTTGSTLRAAASAVIAAYAQLGIASEDVSIYGLSVAYA